MFLTLTSVLQNKEKERKEKAYRILSKFGKKSPSGERG